MGATPAPAATAPKKRSRIRRAASQYRHARRSLRTPASVNSRRGLDWANFFIADVQTGFGTFVAFYLASLGWSHRNVGFALGVSGLAAVLGLIPGGALADAVPWKRGLVAAGVAMICTAALILALAPTLPLGVRGHDAAWIECRPDHPDRLRDQPRPGGQARHVVRTGRNFRFSAAGTALTATLLGAIGSFLSPWAIFLAAAALCMPAVVALSYIRPEEIDYARARNASPGERARQFHRVIDLAKNHPLVLFAGCLVLFQFTNASILPLIGEGIAASGAASGSLRLSGLIIASQVVVAVLAPWAGYLSEHAGANRCCWSASGW
jgi:Permeases of the major facilitator superfamily